MKEYTLKEAADVLGWSYERLKTDARREKFPTIDIPYGTGRFKKGITSETLDTLRASDTKGHSSDSYKDMANLVITEMKTGVWDGKGKTLTDGWIDTIEDNLERYWEILKVKPSILGVNAQNFKMVMASFAINWETKQDWYSTKMHIYKAVTGLMKVLIREGYKTQQDLDAIRKFRPGKVFELKKNFLELEDIEAALACNAAWVNGRTQYDVMVMDLLISLYAFGGLRKMEAAYVRLDQLHLDKGYMHVYGKWAKERIVPLFPVLKEKLESWLNNPLRQKVSSNLIVPQIDGSPLTKTAISTRFQRFKDEFGKKINPHDLRRSCATIATIHGMPDGLMQKMLGHKHASTTEGYKMTQDKHLIEWAQTFDFGIKPKPQQQGPEQAHQQIAPQQPKMIVY